MPVSVAGGAAGLAADGTDSVAAVHADVVVEGGQARVTLATQGAGVAVPTRGGCGAWKEKG